MEYIEGKTLHECSTLTDPQKHAIIAKLTEAVQSMKSKKYVHGDLRSPNLMRRDCDSESESPTPIVTDFDWSGIEGEVKYPNQVVDWPTTAKPGLPILTTHDMEMVNGDG